MAPPEVADATAVTLVGAVAAANTDCDVTPRANTVITMTNIDARTRLTGNPLD